MGQSQNETQFLPHPAGQLSGRRVATLARGFVRAESDVIRLEWRPAGGGVVKPGLYFVRASAPSAGLRVERKVVVTP